MAIRASEGPKRLARETAERIAADHGTSSCTCQGVPLGLVRDKRAVPSSIDPTSRKRKASLRG